MTLEEIQRLQDTIVNIDGVDIKLRYVTLKQLRQLAKSRVDAALLLKLRDTTTVHTIRNPVRQVKRRRGKSWNR